MCGNDPKFESAASYFCGLVEFGIGLFQAKHLNL